MCANCNVVLGRMFIKQNHQNIYSELKSIIIHRVDTEGLYCIRYKPKRKTFSNIEVNDIAFHDCYQNHK